MAWQGGWRPFASTGLPHPSSDCLPILQARKGQLWLAGPDRYIPSHGTGQPHGPAAAGELHPIGAGLVTVEALFNGVPAAHGGLSLLAVSHSVQQLGVGHCPCAGLPCGEISGGGVGGGHGVTCGDPHRFPPIREILKGPCASA